jgi:hypothetical protein
LASWLKLFENDIQFVSKLNVSNYQLEGVLEIADEEISTLKHNIFDNYLNDKNNLFKLLDDNFNKADEDTKK